MATQKKNFGMQGTSGTFGKLVVFKQYRERTVLSKYPDMSKIKPSEKQQTHRRAFKRAAVYAKQINNDPVIKAACQLIIRPGETVYTVAMAEFMAEFRRTGKYSDDLDLVARLTAKQERAGTLCRETPYLNGVVPLVRRSSY